MRSFIVMAMFTASLADAAWFDYEESRNLELDGAGIGELRIGAGAGSLDVTGTDGDRIVVHATIRVDENDDDEARRIIESGLELTLVRDGDVARLDAGFGRIMSVDASVDLDVRIPAGMDLTIDDSSGSITVNEIRGYLRIDDGSGSIRAIDIGGASIDDGSGSIEISGSEGDIEIIDGSGSISVRAVSGSVVVDDGSGSIRISDVGQDVIIEEAGSGSVRISEVRGSIERDD